MEGHQMPDRLYGLARRCGTQRWRFLATLANAVWLGFFLCVGASPTHAEEDLLRSAALGEQSYVLAAFYSDTCPACDEMQPVVREVLKRYPQVLFQTVDADREVALSRRYEVKCVPVYVVLDTQGQVRFNEVGMRTVQELEQILEQAGVGGR